MPQIDMPDILSKYGGVFGKGLLIMAAPSIAKGMLVEMFKREKVTVTSTTALVNDNIKLWDTFAPNLQESLKVLASKIGNTEWITPAWIIDSIKNDFPSVASLFLGWKKAGNWLTRQVQIIKEEITSDKAEG